MLLFLDLEETLINNWSDGLVLPANIDLVRNNFKSLNPTVGLMSWAVWNDKDKNTFNTEHRPLLENLLGMKFSDSFLWSMDDWASMFQRFHNKRVSREDLFDVFSKHEVLFMLSRSHPDFKNQDVVLVDDVVEHGLHWRSVANNCSVGILNIKRMANES